MDNYDFYAKLKVLNAKIIQLAFSYNNGQNHSYLFTE
jgi:hypothetical protein